MPALASGITPSVGQDDAQGNAPLSLPQDIIAARLWFCTAPRSYELVQGITTRTRLRLAGSILGLAPRACRKLGRLRTAPRSWWRLLHTTLCTQGNVPPSSASRAPSQARPKTNDTVVSTSSSIGNHPASWNQMTHRDATGPNLPSPIATPLPRLPRLSLGNSPSRPRHPPKRRLRS